MSRTTHRALRLALASLIATALLAQLAISLSKSDLTIVRFFSFFTVLSNTAAAVMLTLLAGRPGRDGSAGFAMFRGAVTVYMTVTFLVYAIVLAPDTVDVGLTEPWIDWTLHIIGPIAVTADWLFSPPATSLEPRTVSIWIVFPAVYLAYTLIRGPIVDWYPYPILDPNQSDGYAMVAMWSAVVLVVIVVFGFLYRWWGNRQVVGGRSA
ncbi:MAG: Pr6Pr family membrane protein [Acidimicrobiia bacterium]